MQVHSSAISSNEGCFPSLGTGEGSGDFFTMENLYPPFRQKGEGRELSPVPAVCQLSSAQINPYAKLAYFFGSTFFSFKILFY